MAEEETKKEEQEKKEAKAAEGSSPDASEEASREVKEEAAPEPKKEEAPAAAEAKADKPAEAPAQDEGEDVEVPAKFKDIVEKIEKMSVLDLNELVKLFEKKFGVSAAAVAVAGAGAGDAGDAEEKSEFTVELISDGGSKIPVMKVVKEILGLGLKEAKDLVEGVPSVLKEEVKKVEAEEMKSKIEEVGGKVELK